MNLALAVEYGTNESLFLTNLCFWLEKNKANKVHFHRGRYWVYNTMEAWVELFPYFTKDQIRHLIDKMKQKKILLVGVFNRTRYDRTQWYSVSDEVISLYQRGTTSEHHIKDDDSPNCPGGQLQVGDVPEPTAPQGACKWEMSHIEKVNFPDRSGTSPTPIPYNKPDKKQADAAVVKKQEEKAAVAFSNIEKIRDSLNNIDSILIFDNSFYSKAVIYLAEEKLSDEYMAWVYKECQKRKPENLRGLYYSLFFLNDILALCREYETRKENTKPIQVYCPVCGFSYDTNLNKCPNCNFYQKEGDDKDKVERHKNFLNLSSDEKAAYEEEQMALLSLLAKNPSNYLTLKKKWVEIEKKYHLLE
jgi:hypothetical protein